MRKFISLLLIPAAAFAFVACAPTQELRKDANFEGLKTYYLMPASGGDVVFNQLGTRAEYDKMLADAIKEIMSARGFTNVPSADGAQFALRPVYSEWVFNEPKASDIDINFTSTTGIGNQLTQYYLNLEIEAYLPTMAKWAWRGLSYTKLTRFNMNKANISDQAKWALQHFPPEANPSNTQKKEAAEKSEK